MEARSFQLRSDISECATSVLAESNGVSADQSIDIKGAKPNALHMERPDRVAQRCALFEKGVTRWTLLLCLHLGDERLQVFLGGFSVISSGHSWSRPSFGGRIINGSLISMARQAESGSQNHVQDLGGGLERLQLLHAGPRMGQRRS